MVAGNVLISIKKSAAFSNYYEVKEAIWEVFIYGLRPLVLDNPRPISPPKPWMDRLSNSVSSADRQSYLALSATWCKDCEKQIPFLNQVYGTHQELVMLDVDAKEPESLVREYANEIQINYPVLVDSNGEINRVYQNMAYPTIFIIDSEGVIRFVIVGELKEENLMRALQLIGSSN